MEEQTALLLKIVEDVTETRTLIDTMCQQRSEEISERKERQQALDTRFLTIETKLDSTTNKIDEAVSTWKAIKMVGSSVIALLVGIITLDWHSVSSNWSGLFK